LQGRPGAACLDFQHEKGEAAGPQKEKLMFNNPENVPRIVLNYIKDIRAGREI